jgi:hypothetical protein
MKGCGGSLWVALHAMRSFFIAASIKSMSQVARVRRTHNISRARLVPLRTVVHIRRSGWTRTCGRNRCEDHSVAATRQASTAVKTRHAVCPRHRARRCKHGCDRCVWGSCPQPNRPPNSAHGFGSQESWLLGRSRRRCGASCGARSTRHKATLGYVLSLWCHTRREVM